MPFFSKDFTATALAPKDSKSGGYINPSAIEDGGSIRLAILSESPLEGVEVWFTKNDGGMTKRITPEWPDPELLAQLEAQVGGKVTERDGRKAIKACSAFAVYAWEDAADPSKGGKGGSVKVFSANQKTLLADIERLTSDPDYADLSQYDLKISRSGKGTDTKYHVSMAHTWRAKDSVKAAVYEAWDEVCTAGFDLEALYEGGNPFGNKS